MAVLKSFGHIPVVFRKVLIMEVVLPLAVDVPVLHQLELALPLLLIMLLRLWMGLPSPLLPPCFPPLRPLHVPPHACWDVRGADIRVSLTGVLCVRAARNDAGTGSLYLAGDVLKHLNADSVLNL